MIAVGCKPTFTKTNFNQTAMPNIQSAKRQSINSTPTTFVANNDLPKGFLDFYKPLHEKYFAWQQSIRANRKIALNESLGGNLPQHLPVSDINFTDWKITLPSWITDQRNQMTGPADDAPLVVKMINSGAPGVMLDLEDSMANTWNNLTTAYRNVRKALYGDLCYHDEKRDSVINIKPSNTVVFTRLRGLHMHQAGILEDSLTSASLFDAAMLVYRIDFNKLKHPLCFYLPKTESAEEAKFWASLFKDLAIFKGVDTNYIKCMALVESHPLAYQIEEFIYHLRDHLIGLNLGRWDYMASLIHFNLNDSNWVLPDRNTIPGDVAFFQNLRKLIPEICHKRGIFAIGGMTALFPDRQNPELNNRALENLARDKKNEADCLFDGAWTGHPDQNQIAMEQFPEPNQLSARPTNAERYPDLRPIPLGIGTKTVKGSKAAARVTILYRYGVLKGKGASLIDGYMEDLATDRIYRLMLTQRCMHWQKVPILSDNGETAEHNLDFLTKLFDCELKKILLSIDDERERSLYTAARYQAEEMIRYGWHNPQ